MPTYTAEIYAVVPHHGKIVVLDAAFDGTRFQARLTASKLANNDDWLSPVKVAEWMIAQKHNFTIMEPIRVDPANSIWRGRLTITTHIEQVEVPEIDGPIDVEIVDSATASTLPADRARDGIRAMPGWADWTAAEAEAWIEANVTDLESAKAALVAMAKLLVRLRDRSLAEGR